MGLASIDFQSLESQTVRSAIGDAGTRILDLNGDDDKDSDGGIISTIGGWLGKFGGWLLEKAKDLLGGILKFSLSTLWGLFVNTAQFIWNFDWNQTDKSIDDQIKGSWAAIGGLLGGTVGNALGYLACGILPGATIFAFNEALGMYILKEVGQEMAEELAANLSNVIRGCFNSTMQTIIMWGFKNVRKWLKSQSPLVSRLFGDHYAKALRSWGEEGSKPWSFASATEEAVDSIPNSFVRNFVEELLEEAWEGCIDAGYAAAKAVSDYAAQQKLAKTKAEENKTRYVEITLDRSNPKEKIILAGPERELKPVIVQTINQYHLLGNRNLGVIVGQPIDDYLRPKPQTIRLVAHFYSVPSPPWKDTTGKNAKRCEIAVPDVKRSKLDWQTIKRACGGANGYMYGRYLALADLSNGRQMQVYGSTPDEAEDRLRAMAELSEADILRKPKISEDRSEDASGGYVKQAIKMYPAYFTIFNQYKVPGAQGSGAKQLVSGSYYKESDIIDLWLDEAPNDFNERINNLLQRPGANTP